MGNVYCALNHDTKTAYHIGKSHTVIEMLGEWAHMPDYPYEYFKFKELKLFDMVKFLAEAWPDWRIDHIEKLCRELIEFKPQSIYEECDDAVLEYYRDYKYSGSIYANHFDYSDDCIGEPIHTRDDDHVIDGDLRPQDAPHLKTPPLVGKLGTMHGTVIHCSNPAPVAAVEKLFLNPGSIHVVHSESPSRPLGVQWSLGEPITIKIGFSGYVKGRTYVSKRLRKIRAKRIKFTYEETKGGSIQSWLETWQQNVIGDLQQQIKENDVKLNEQAENIANILKG